MSQVVRLAYLVSHPIQYQAPLLRRIAAEPEIDLLVLFGSDFSLRSYRDQGFGVDVEWDTPLLDGYHHEFLPSLRDDGTEGILSPISRGLFTRLAHGVGGKPFDALWVHGYSTANQMQGILAARALGIPVLVRSDSSLIDRPRSAAKLAAKHVFFRSLRSLIDGILVSGTLNHEYWKHYMGSDFPMFLLPYAVDNQWFQQRAFEAAANRRELETELNLEPGRPVILFASKMQTRKHGDDLLQSYISLCANSDIKPYLLFVGDGEERSELERQAAASGLDGIRFCGFRNQSELPGFFDLCTVFVLPAKHEPWGLVINEVMNAAKPVIVTDEAGCHPDLITQGVEGFVYPARDVEALAAALRAVLSTPATARTMGAAALARINGWSFEQDVVGLKQALAHVTRRLPSGEHA